MGDFVSGVVYVRERGQLRCVNGIVLAETSPAASARSTSSCLAWKKEHFVFTYNNEGSLKYSAKSLYDIALLFVAYNIHHVDSLNGFPEQIGDRIFAVAEEKQIFSDPNAAPRALQLFSDAYGEVVLRSLCLRDRFPLLFEKMEEIKTFRSLKSLDLFGCRLGDSHDIFQHLTSDALSSSLAQLSLGGNSLSDQGLRRLTAPVRMLKRGLRHLEHIDLSYNPLTENAVGYLTCLPKLKGLDITSTNIQVSLFVKKTIRHSLGLVLSEKPLEVFDHSCCKTDGWAEQVISQWEFSASKLPSPKNVQDARKSALSFFGREKFVRGILSATHLVENEEEEKTERIHFYKPAASEHTQQRESRGSTRGPTRCAETTPELRKPSTKDMFQTTGMQSGHMKYTQLTGTTDGHSGQVTTCCENRKRPGRTEIWDSGHNRPPAKRASSSSLPAFTAEDLDLLNSY
ncbi:hypothetical protein UPYG_G00296600 [Umbra pygmaea]|uniref:Leucine-rich repeat-containing protein 42 n=1 Tax=Umbra pygmaea TaxID=75934 RepID=A0ABD0WLZ7_UMBPY